MISTEGFIVSYRIIICNSRSATLYLPFSRHIYRYHRHIQFVRRVIIKSLHVTPMCWTALFMQTKWNGFFFFNIETKFCLKSNGFFDYTSAIHHSINVLGQHSFTINVYIFIRACHFVHLHFFSPLFLWCQL